LSLKVTLDEKKQQELQKELSIDSKLKRVRGNVYRKMIQAIDTSDLTDIRAETSCELTSWQKNIKKIENEKGASQRIVVQLGIWHKPAQKIQLLLVSQLIQ